MLNSMIVARERINGQYSITLEVPGKEYFEIYSDLDKEAAEDILKQYMTYHGDDGRYFNVSISQSRNSDIVSIHANLNYEDNDHTEQFVIPHYLDDSAR
jgi:hypothetical protein